MTRLVSAALAFHDRHRRVLGLAEAVVAVLAISHCGTSGNPQNCPGEVTPPIIVTVLEKGSGLYICNASVTAVAGSSQSGASQGGTQDASLTDASCVYEINPHASGTYSIVASAPGFQAVGTAPQVTVQFNSCGTVDESDFVTVELMK